MKKILGMLSVFLGIAFVLCFVLGFVLPVTEGVPENGRFMFKFCTGMEYFLTFLPAVLFTGILVSFSVHFGHNAEGSTTSFAPAMFTRYKNVMISSLICAFLLMLSNETIGMMLNHKKEKIVTRPKIIAQYIDSGKTLYNQGLYDRSLMYANAALRMDPNSKEARNLVSMIDIEMNRSYIQDLRFDLTNAEPVYSEDNSLKIDKEQLLDAYKCLLKASSAYDSGQWFDAHYYAEMGIKLATSKDPNVQKLRQISADSWNNLTDLNKTAKTQSEEIFEEKYRGFVALMEDDDLQAYYIFRYLNETYPELEKDNDVQFYFKVAQDRVEQKYFFIDETFELKSFEDANDVYFSYRQLDGSTDIIYFKGLSYLKSAGSSVQYLRDLTILKIKNGKWFRTMHVPYAKVMPVSVKSLNTTTKAMLGISDDADFVPYILLKSVGRDDSDQEYTPLYTYADGETTRVPEYMIYPMLYSDFLLLEKTASNPKTMPLSTLFALNSKASDYGFTSELFRHTLLNRLLYPLFILIVIMMIGVFSWSFRIGQTLYFRMSWVFSFPFFMVIMYFFYHIMLYIFKLLNYALIILTQGKGALSIGIVFYIILLLISSIYFLSQKAE
jgi:tetratricopeptide (TPR) repeat protein